MPALIPSVCFQVDLAAYPRVTRVIRRLYPKPSHEMQCLIVNLLHHHRLSVPRRKTRYTRIKHGSYPRTLAAVEMLLHDGYITLHREGKQGEYSTAYERTELFETVFHFYKLPARLVVQRSALTRGSLGHVPNSIDRIPELQTYSSLISRVKLSLSNGGQVFEDIVLTQGRKGGRLYQRGTHGYQTLPKKERPYLRMNGKRLIEIDYVALHPSMLLALQGQAPPQDDLYSSVLQRLGLPIDPELRAAIKLSFLIGINIPTVSGFCSTIGKQAAYKTYLKPLGCKPKNIYEAIVAAHPLLKPFIGTGKRSWKLQQADSRLMTDVLESLAKLNIAALPEHDSVSGHPKPATRGQVKTGH